MINLEIFKTADKNYVLASSKDRIKYFVSIKNIGDSKATDVRIRDIISKGVCFILGTFSVNNCKWEVNNIDNYIRIGDIDPGATTIITFEVQIIDRFLINEVVNKVVVSYHGDNCEVHHVESNKVTIPVIKISICAQKKSDKNSVCIGEIITYTISLKNNGNIDINDVVFYDCLSDNVELLPGSIIIDLIEKNVKSLDEGLYIGTIEPNSSVIIIFKVRVTSMPKYKYIENIGRFEFSYSVLNNLIDITSIGESVTNKVKINVKDCLITC